MRVQVRRVPRAAMAVAIVAVGAPLMLMSGSAGAAGPGPNTRVPVTSGIDVQHLNGAQSAGPATTYTEYALSFVLKPHTQLLFSEAQRSLGNRYLSVPQFAAEFGARSQYVHQLEQYLSQYGISNFTLYPNGLDLKAVGTTAEVGAAFGIQEVKYQLPAVPSRNGVRGSQAQEVYAPRGGTTLPERLAQTIVAILGLTNYAPWVSQSAHATTTPSTASSTPCIALTGLPNACNTPATFAANYGLTGLYKQGANGQGQTIGIVTLAALNQTAPAHFWNTVLHLPATGRTVQVQTVDGGPGAPSTTSGSGETNLDTEQSGALAPGANVRVYQAPNTTAGFVDAFMTAASQDIAGTVSSSWGESEALIRAFGAAGFISPGYQAAFDEVFAEMAVQGQSLFVATGDSGAYADNRTTGGEWNTLGIQAPSDSPFVTAAGGTTLPFSGTVTYTLGKGKGTDLKSAHVSVASQRAWGWDYLAKALSKTNGIPFPTVARKLVLGDTGGYSTFESTPLYQQDVPGVQRYSAVPYFTPTGTKTDATTLIGALYGLSHFSVVTTYSANPAPGVIQGSATGRAVPDVSTNADPLSGYLLYNPSAATGTYLQGDWGGTSFVAPQLNGAAAVINSSIGHRAGFWNPSIYAFASQPNSPFTPLDQSGATNDNWYYTGTPGSRYNPATGLGVPNLTRLAADFASSYR